MHNTTPIRREIEVHATTTTTTRIKQIVIFLVSECKQHGHTLSTHPINTPYSPIINTLSISTGLLVSEFLQY